MCGPRQPARLAALFQRWLNASEMYGSSPVLVFAVIGQARADGASVRRTKSALLAKLLTYWALRATVNTSELRGHTRGCQGCGVTINDGGSDGYFESEHHT